MLVFPWSVWNFHQLVCLNVDRCPTLMQKLCTYIQRVQHQSRKGFYTNIQGMNHASGGQWNLGIRMKLVGRPTRILLGRKLKYSLIYPLSLTQVSLSTSGMFQTLNICAEPFTSKDDICAEPFIIRQIECIIRQCGGLSGRPATSQKESHEDQRGIKELAGYLLSVLRSHDPPQKAL